MKITKKHIIILVIVAVVVYFLYKKMKANNASATTSGNTGTNSNTGSSVGTSDLEAVITAAGISSELAKKVRTAYEAYDQPAYASNKKRVEELANQRGITYEQSLLLEVLYYYYYYGGDWEGTGKTAYQAIYNRVTAM